MTSLTIRKTLRVCSAYILALGTSLAMHCAIASDLTVPNSFSAGTPAVADEVNANFTAVESAVNDNDARIAELEAKIQALETLVAGLQASIVPNLGTYLRIDRSDPTRPKAVFEAVNVQVVNGSGSTLGGGNGLGNLIVGYDEARNVDSDKSGSHNLVVGPKHNYRGVGGFVAGFSNTLFRASSSVSGGAFNTASETRASVSGGEFNFAVGWASSVSGGNNNFAVGDHSSVCGGFFNSADGEGSTVSGGSTNRADGLRSTVSGGFARSVLGDFDWAAGSLFQEQ